MVFDRILPFLFNAGMAVYFIYAFLFQEATAGWLDSTGWAVMVLEFLGVFILLLLAHVLGKNSGWTVHAQGNPWLVLALVMLMALLFSWVLGALVLFAYFLVSTVIKAFQIRSAPDAFTEGTQAVYSTLFLVLGAFAAVFLQPVAEVLRALVLAASAMQNGSSFSYSSDAVMEPAFIALWGLFYFAGLALVSLKPDLLPIKPATPEQLAWARSQAPAFVDEDDGFDMPKGLSDWLKKIK